MQKGLSSAGPVAAINTAGAVAAGGAAAKWPVRAIGLLFAALLVIGAVAVQRANSAPPKAELRTAQVTRGAVTQTVAVSGSVNPANTWRLNFKTAGRLAEILVSVGQQVAVGQTLAKLDTTDLLITVKQQQANVASAQAKYDQTLAGATPEDIAIAKQSVDSAKKTLDETPRTLANDVAAAKQALTKLKTSYASAEASFTNLSTAVKTETVTISPLIDGIRNQLAQAQTDIKYHDQLTNVTSAQASLNLADTALINAQSYMTQLTTALSDYSSARDSLSSAISSFDDAILRGTDSSGASALYQAASSTYSSAATKLTNALDAPGSAISTAQSSVASAQNAITTPTMMSDRFLDQARADLVGLQGTFTTETQLTSSLKSRITQIGTSLTTLSDAIAGSYVAAQQSVTTTQEKSTASLQSAQNGYDSAIASYAKTTAPVRSYDIASAYAGLLTAQANLDTANNNLSYATLIAPGAGVIGAINAQIGEQVAGGGTNNAFMTIANTSQLAVHGTVGEADIAKLKLGQVATVTVDAVGGSSRMTGKVTALDPVATIQQGVPVYGVDITVDVPNALVRPGMSGTANVILASRQDVLVVPNLAVRSQGNRRFVQVLKDGQPVDADVVFGISNDSVIEVTSGLQEGDTVVLPQPRAAVSGQPRPGGFPGGGGGQPVIVGR